MKKILYITSNHPPPKKKQKIFPPHIIVSILTARVKKYASHTKIRHRRHTNTALKIMCFFRGALCMLLCVLAGRKDGEAKKKRKKGGNGNEKN